MVERRTVCHVAIVTTTRKNDGFGRWVISASIVVRAAGRKKIEVLHRSCCEINQFPGIHATHFSVVNDQAMFAVCDVHDGIGGRITCCYPGGGNHPQHLVFDLAGIDLSCRKLHKIEFIGILVVLRVRSLNAM